MKYVQSILWPLLAMLVTLATLLPSAVHATTCYTVYNRTERVIFQSENPPVDMTQVGIAQEVRSKFGADTFMVFNENPVCAEIDALAEPAPVTLPASNTPASTTVLAPVSTTVSGYRCDGRKYCSQMHSCDEAKFFLKNCPGVRMDGNGDGIPCEKQWCGRK